MGRQAVVARLTAAVGAPLVVVLFVGGTTLHEPALLGAAFGVALGVVGAVACALRAVG